MQQHQTHQALSYVVIRFFFDAQEMPIWNENQDSIETCALYLFYYFTSWKLLPFLLLLLSFCFALGETACCTPKFLFFCIASPDVPATSSSNSIKVKFHRDPRTVYPKARTCTAWLHLPTCHTSYESFKDKLNQAIELEGQGFMIA